MGFFVRKSNKHNFRIIQETWTPNRKEEVVPRESYQTLGFRYDMTLDEARERAKQINKQSQIEAKKIAAVFKRIEDDKEINEAYLPKRLVESFEKELSDNYSDNEERLEHILQHWRAAKKVISHLALDPKDFSDEKNKFFNYYRLKKWSPDYIKKLNSIINQWGVHYAKKTNSFFERLPKLNLTQVERLIDVRENIEGRKTTADPLVWNDLKNQKSAFENQGLVKQWNWLFVSLFFGLRPTETDNIVKSKPGKYWKIEHDSKRKIDILYVFQTKLVTKSKENRWKPIPIFFEEQKLAIKIIQSGELKRPLNKTIQRFFEYQVETYSPRKGFTDLMLERGFDIEDVSIFMGHSDISMTWKRYKDKFTFKIPKAG